MDNGGEFGSKKNLYLIEMNELCSNKLTVLYSI